MTGLDADEIRNQLQKNNIDGDPEILDEVDSTNRLARERAIAGAPSGTLVIADRQRAGRGRDGRRWHSPPGSGLYMTSISRAPIAVADGGLAPLAVGLAAAAAIEARHPVSIALKWPNDLMSGGRKLGGILVESATGGGRLTWLSVGIGVNLLGDPEALPGEIAERATTLEALGASRVDREALAVEIHVRVLAAMQRLATDGGRWVREAFRGRDDLRDRRVRVSTGEDEFTGTASGIDPTGALLVRDAGGRRLVRTGSVRLAD